jgi:hypothetical protein
MIKVIKTCDECRFYNLYSGKCRCHNELKKSCGADTCEDFEYADDLKLIAATGKE